jgi:hypothetical protein
MMETVFKIENSEDIYKPFPLLREQPKHIQY